MEWDKANLSRGWRLSLSLKRAFMNLPTCGPHQSSCWLSCKSRRKGVSCEGWWRLRSKGPLVYTCADSRARSLHPGSGGSASPRLTVTSCITSGPMGNHFGCFFLHVQGKFRPDGFQGPVCFLPLYNFYMTKLIILTEIINWGTAFWFHSLKSYFWLLQIHYILNMFTS